MKEIKGNGRVESLVLKNVENGNTWEEAADGLFFFVGMVPQTELVKDLVECTADGYIKVSEKKETSLPGLYAAGDCTSTYLRQVVTSAADGAVAATACQRYIKEKIQLEEILGPDSGQVAFLFYNPYHTEEIDVAGELEKRLGADWKIYRQDVTRQDLLYRELKIRGTVSAAFYQKGRLLEVKTADECLRGF